MLQVVLVPSSTNTVNTINTQLTTVGVLMHHFGEGGTPQGGQMYRIYIYIYVVYICSIYTCISFVYIYTTSG